MKCRLCGKATQADTLCRLPLFLRRKEGPAASPPQLRTRSGAGLLLCFSLLQLPCFSLLQLPSSCFFPSSSSSFPRVRWRRVTRKGPSSRWAAEGARGPRGKPWLQGAPGEPRPPERLRARCGAPAPHTRFRWGVFLGGMHFPCFSFREFAEYPPEEELSAEPSGCFPLPRSHLARSSTRLGAAGDIIVSAPCHSACLVSAEMTGLSTKN